jgi:hypothetical protein
MLPPITTARFASFLGIVSPELVSQLTVLYRVRRSVRWTGDSALDVPARIRFRWIVVDRPPSHAE